MRYPPPPNTAQLASTATNTVPIPNPPPVKTRHAVAGRRVVHLPETAVARTRERPESVRATHVLSLARCLALVDVNTCQAVPDETGRALTRTRLYRRRVAARDPGLFLLIDLVHTRAVFADSPAPAGVLRVADARAGWFFVAVDFPQTRIRTHAPVARARGCVENRGDAPVRDFALLPHQLSARRTHAREERRLRGYLAPGHPVTCCVSRARQRAFVVLQTLVLEPLVAKLGAGGLREPGTQGAQNGFAGEFAAVLLLRKKSVSRRVWLYWAMYGQTVIS